MSETLLFLLAAVAVFFMARSLYNAAIRQYVAWRGRDSTWQIFVLGLSGMLLVVVALAWLYLAFITVSFWFSSFEASRPKPPILILWAIGLFVYGIGISLVGTLHTLALREWQKDSSI